MICPNCRTLVPDGSVICTHCDTILDASFLGEDITNDSRAAAPKEDATRIKQVEQDATRVKSAAEVKKPAAKAAKPAAPEAAPAPEATYKPEPKKRASLAETAAPPPQTAEALEELVKSFKELPFSERMTSGGALGLLITLGLPWRSTRDEGDLIGLVAGGWPIALLAILITVAVFLRRHPRVAAHRDRVLGGTAALSAVALLAAIAFWRTATVEQVLKAGGRLVTQTLEKAEFGVYLGMIAAAIMLLGATKSYLDRARLD